MLSHLIPYFFWYFICSSKFTCIVSLSNLQNKRRREEEEYYASQQPGYVPPPPKKKWYQKFRRNKKNKSAEVSAYDGGDFSQMEDTTDDGWSTRSFGNY